MAIFWRFCALAALVFWSAAARAQDSSTQLRTIKAAFAAGDSGEWQQAFALLPPGDQLARELLLWTQLRQDPQETGATWDDFLKFVPARREWPAMDRVQRFGETLLPTGVNAASVLRFFGDSPPQTGAGLFHLVLALSQSGQDAKALELLAEGWTRLSLTPQEEERLIAAFGRSLAPIHTERLAEMLWNQRLGEAERMLSHVDPETRNFAERLIFNFRDPDAVTSRLEALPADHPFFAVLPFVRFRGLMEARDWTGAVTILARQSNSLASLGRPEKWANNRRILARWRMREGDYQTAYDLASRHYLTPEAGFAYADLEWLAGYVALRWLNDPTRALVHFDRHWAVRKGPISTARAGYWLGRTFDALGQTDNGRVAYEAAALHQTAFYGLLAAERLGLSLDSALYERKQRPSWKGAAFLDREEAHAAFLLLAGQQRIGAFHFFQALASQLSADELGQLSDILTPLGQPYYSVIAGKEGVERGQMVADLLFPAHPLTNKEMPVETSLAMAIARQESEFREDVGSPAGALGLMQLLPSTAEEVARDLGLPFDRWRLVTDWDFNVTLGAEYLARLEQQFGPSPVLIAAGYNAGPGRPRDWIAARGDPRTGAVDIVDWIELIPFRETRNYVKRVSEAIPIYRARLSGASGSVQFKALLTGSKPVIRPQARPRSFGRTTQSESAVIDIQTALREDIGTAPSHSLRPQVRQ